MAVTIDGSNTPTAGGVVYGDGTEYASTAAGTSGQSLLSAGSSAPTWGTPASATTATNLAGGSAGTVPYQSASGTTQMLAAGTSGQVLTSSGAGAPSWTTPSAGALVYLSTQTVSGTPSTVDFTSGISSTYDDYIIFYEGVKSSLSNNEIFIRLFKSGAFQTSGYNWTYLEYRDSAIGGANQGGSATGQIVTNSGNTSATLTNQSGTVYLCNVNSAVANACNVRTQTVGMGGSVAENYVAQAGGSQNTAAVVTGIRFLFGSGANFSSGTFRLYGVAKA